MDYSKFVRLKGRPLSEINPGSEAFALSISDAIASLSILESSRIPILGGDILSETENGRLIYAYRDWGSEYHCLNWYCDSIENEPYDKYLVRCYDTARNAINKAKAVAEKLDKKIYIVVVAKTSFS